MSASKANHDLPFCQVFLSGSLTVALPTIGADLKFSEADLQWPMNVYALAYGCLMLLFGRVGDIVGGRFMFLAGSLFFAAWTLVAAFAPTQNIFIISMAFMGIGAAANTPASLGLAALYFPPGPNRTKAYSALGAGQPLGCTLGLVLGGILTGSKATWRSAFYIQAGLAVLFAVIGFFLLPKPTTRGYSKGLDFGGAILSSAGLALLTYSLSDSTMTPRGWSAPQVPSILSVSILVLGLFVWYEMWRERKGMSVLLPMSIWTRPGTKLGPLMLCVFFAWWNFNTCSYFYTLYFQQVKLLSPLQASLWYLPLALSGVIPAVLVAYFLGYFSGFSMMLVGILFSTASPLIFALIKVDLIYWAMTFPMVVCIVGVDAIYPIGNLQITAEFDEDSQSLAGGIFNVTTRIATSLGLAVTSSIAANVSQKYNHAHADLSSTSPEVLMVGFRAAGWTCFATSVISLIVAVFWLRDIGNVKTDSTGAPEEGTDSDTATQVNVSVEPKEKDVESGPSENEGGLTAKVITPAPSTLFTATSRTQSIHSSSSCAVSVREEQV
ncbi:MFS general substrate transporter [Coniophora puteana RWD-64-598 SS2]|uniref:MFS general substrate transporter n=1 Tax=Coniophora puteana (strain RWD-64-598) TaxID=741705 RepID=A0A5M3N5I5_CONPW|nr:MFS general substrate transporter [Coniophora puteana RWD-64-598 SS2]EIW86181.1 MFS general substrate transporter [Coniophora puteana RWD-64-598 SS2]